MTAPVKKMSVDLAKEFFDHRADLTGFKRALIAEDEQPHPRHEL